jgi:hypothetical protein
MCKKRVEGSGKHRYVILTNKFHGGRVVFLSKNDDRRSGMPEFTDDIWEARTWISRKDMGDLLELTQKRTKYPLIAHLATAALTIPE